MKFEELDLQPEILKSLAEMNYVELTPIQEATFKPILENSDLLALAQTGSGKTSACSIPLIQKINSESSDLQALVLVPTRELALQYVDEIDKVSKHVKVNPFAIFGGFSAEIQKAKLNDGVQILVATPGRLIDFIYSGVVSLNSVKTLVLDEADEMLNMGFLEDIEFIFSCLVHDHQTLMFSATMPKDIEKITQNHLDHPQKVNLIKKNQNPNTIEHQFNFLPHHARTKEIKKYLNEEKVDQVIIFSNSKNGCEQIYNNLKEEIKNIDFIHGGLDQNVRSSLFNKFKNSKIKILIATDVAGRGLDFSKVSHVINYDFPNTRESYTHRTGRTGRIGRQGKALTYVTPRDLHDLRKLLEATKIEPKWLGKEPNLDKKQLHDQFHRDKKKKGSYYQNKKKSNPYNKNKKPRRF